MQLKKIKKNNVLCKIHIPNLAKDFQSETNMPSIKVHQCRDIYPKLSVLKQHDQICKFKKNAFCNVRFLNLAKDYKSETRMPFMNVHQCRDIYPKLSVLKCCGNFCWFFDHPYCILRPVFVIMGCWFITMYIALGPLLCM